MSIIQYVGKQNKSKCGYCKSEKTSYSHGMWAYCLTVEDYQSLIDRGWRRSGQYCYKPQNKITCCPSYTIRCDANSFELSKSQKKTIKKFNKYLSDGIILGKQDVNQEDPSNVPLEFESPNINIEKLVNINMNTVEESVSTTNHSLRASNPGKSDILDNSKLTTDVNMIKNVCTSSESVMCASSSQSNKNIKKGIGPDVDKPLCKKAKLMRLERKALKQGNSMSEIISKPPKNVEKTLEIFLNEANTNDKRHKLQVELIRSNDDKFSRYIDEEYKLFTKYQTIIHNDKPESVDDFVQFLVKSPLQYKRVAGGPPYGYGSFHQQYRIDDKLIAVAVLDILPESVSSVYFFYDPVYSFLSLGTYGTLREINMVQNLSKTISALKYYYMGYYIYSCPKMRYKGNYASSYLLCNEVFTWHLLNESITKRLDVEKYQRFNQDLTAREIDKFKPSDWRNLKIYGYDTNVNSLDVEKVKQYGELVGNILFHRLYYVIN